MALRPSIIEQRGEQMLPVLNALEIERVRRFGECRSFATGEALATIGHVSPGLMVILAGQVEVTHRDKSGQRVTIVTHGPGQLRELANEFARPVADDADALAGFIDMGHVDPAGQNDHQAGADMADGEERCALGERAAFTEAAHPLDLQRIEHRQHLRAALI